MQISLSIESILKKLYALSALRSHLTATPSAVAPYLTEDNRAGLIPVLQDALSHLAVDIFPHMEVKTPPNSIDDLVEVEVNVVKLPSGTDSIMESAIVERMLQILYAPLSEKTSENFASMATATTTRLLMVIRESGVSASSSIPWNGY
ncbi:MAG: hypothetical protein K2M07_05240 [Muribaculaceae bacterium]|nr:hypothetical protein [Muribaculaceae bacterium]